MTWLLPFWLKQMCGALIVPFPLKLTLVQVWKWRISQRMGSEIIWATITTTTYAAVGHSRAFAHGINYWHLLLAIISAGTR